MKKTIQIITVALGALFSMTLFALMIFALYKAIEKEQYELALGVIAVCFVFAFLMLKVPVVNKFFVGGKLFNLSVNDDDDDNQKPPTIGEGQ